MSKQLAKGKRRNNFEQLDSPAIVYSYRKESGYGDAKIEQLIDILRTMRPHGSKSEKRFCRDFLDVIPGMETDGFGNRIISIPANYDGPVAWTSHVDTVHHKGGTQIIRKRKDIVTLGKGSKANCLGADDGAGIWLMLEMIRAEKPGLYMFHRGEECGGLGSDYIAMQQPAYLDNIKAMISLDRYGYHSVITHQGVMTASEEFALSLADALPGFEMAPDDTGLFTDSANYADLIPECTNLSVGYFGHHGATECVDLGFLCVLRDSLIKLDYDALVIKRFPGEDDGYGWASYSRKDNVKVNYVHPNGGMLIEGGLNATDLWRDTAQSMDDAYANTYYGDTGTSVHYDHDAGIAYIQGQEDTDSEFCLAGKAIGAAALQKEDESWKEQGSNFCTAGMSDIIDHNKQMDDVIRADAQAEYDLEFETGSFARLLRDHPETCAEYLMNVGITIDELFHNLEHTNNRD